MAENSVVFARRDKAQREGVDDPCAVSGGNPQILDEIQLVLL